MYYEMNTLNGDLIDVNLLYNIRNDTKFLSGPQRGDRRKFLELQKICVAAERGRRALPASDTLRS